MVCTAENKPWKELVALCWNVGHMNPPVQPVLGYLSDVPALVAFKGIVDMDNLADSWDEALLYHLYSL